MRRRTFLGACSATALAGLAGCAGTSGDGGSTGDGEYPPQYENVFQLNEDGKERDLPGTDSWEMLRTDSLRHGSSDNDGPAGAEPEIQWRFGYGSRGREPFYRFEPIIADGRLYLPSRMRGDYTLYALDERTGDVEWEKDGYGTRFTPIYQDGALYVSGDEDSDELFATLNAYTGETKSTTPFNEFEYQPTIQGPTAVVDGSLYFATRSHVRSVSLETGEVEWEAQAISGRTAESRNTGIESDNGWETGVVYHKETGTVLCGDTTGFAYAIDSDTGDVRWAMALSTGDDFESVGGTSVYKGKDFYRALAPTVYRTEVLYEIGGERGLDFDDNEKNAIISADLETGELGGRAVAVDSEISSSLEGRRINDGFNQNDKTLDFNYNYPTIDGDWIYTSLGGALGALNESTGETWTSSSNHSDSGLVTSPVVGSDAVYAIEYHEYFSKQDVTTVFAMDKKTGEVLWSGETPTQVRQLSIANGTLYASGEHLYALQ